ncbi:hypothetical protein RB653_008045 [Dictyostelium firmibasis]|uniref:Uncharacterized protein n=1 Tax=Dictyostelium firmibasis TaxID=79012 RepID=A0AAN7YZG4_9MYCE
MMNFNKVLKNGIKSMISSSNLNKSIYFNRDKQTTQLFYSNFNKNKQEQIQQQKNKEDLILVKDFLEKVKQEKEFLNKFITNNSEKSGFKYEKGDYSKVSDSLAKNFVSEFEEQVKREDDMYEKLIIDLKNRKIERERILKQEKLKSNSINYLFSVLLLICTVNYYFYAKERAETNQKTFDDKWESLKVIVNNRDSLKEKKSQLITSISTALQSNTNKNNQNNNVDLEEIKEDVESIIKQYCIENKSPNQIYIENNNDISNSKI